MDGDGDSSNEIVEENNYYPFGLKHEGYHVVVNSTNLAQDYEYNGKEFENKLGLDWLDYGWRNYDPTIGRWMNMDNLAGMMKSYSPYSYALNNPIFYVDIDGLMPGGGPNYKTEYYRGPDGTVYFDPNVNENTVLPDGYRYIGPTYYNPETGTFWDDQGNPIVQDITYLDGFVGTPSTNSGASNSNTEAEGNPTYWGIGTEDRGTKGPRKGELSHGDLPGFDTQKGGGKMFERFWKWLWGTIDRVTGVEETVNSEDTRSTMEQKPEPEPIVQHPYSFFLTTFEDGSRKNVFSTSYSGFGTFGNQEAAIRKGDSLLNTDPDIDSVGVSPHFVRSVGSNEKRAVRDTILRRN